MSESCFHTLDIFAPPRDEYRQAGRGYGRATA